MLLVLAGVPAGIWAMVGWNKERNLRPLFLNLGAEDAGAVVERLKAGNVPYKVEEPGTVMVPSERVAELRLEMATAGLPKTGRVGFELFDKANFGATEFSEQVNYRRALEGELERSVMSIGEVERARVHVTFAKESVFEDQRKPAKASVLIKLKPGAVLSVQNVQAIRHLAASAVEGLVPEAVSVVDMAGNLLGKGRQTTAEGEASPGVSDARIEYRQTLEREMLAKIRTTLDPLLGADRYRVGLSMDVDYSSGEQSEETFDPQKQVVATSQKTEDVKETRLPGGVAGIGSNLPNPPAKLTPGSGGTSRKTESTTYQTSRFVKRTTIPQGALRRVSVAVLVDQTVRWEGGGASARRVLEPPPAESLKVVREVIAGTIGFQEERGDQILVETLPFEATLSVPAPASPVSAKEPVPGQKIPSWAEPLLRRAPIPVWLGAAASVVVVMGVFGWWFFRMRKAPPKTAAGKVEAGAPALPPKEDFEKRAHAQLSENQAEKERRELEALAALKLPHATKNSEVLRKHISEQAKVNPEATAQLVRTWLTEAER
jgi:flagellar M-ring protein FliF